MEFLVASNLLSPTKSPQFDPSRCKPPVVRFNSTTKNSDVDIRNPESFRFPPIWYILPIWGLYITYHLTREPGNSIDAVFFRWSRWDFTFSGRGQCTEHRHFSPLGVLNEKIQGQGSVGRIWKRPKNSMDLLPLLGCPVGSLVTGLFHLRIQIGLLIGLEPTYTPDPLTWLAMEKRTCWLSRCIFPIENGDFPASYVSLLEGNNSMKTKVGILW